MGTENAPMKPTPPIGDMLDTHGSIGATQSRIERGETAEENRNETDATGRVTGVRRGHRVGALGRYYARGEINSRQHDAGQRFIDEWEAANRTQRLVPDPDAIRTQENSDVAASMYRLVALRINARRKHDEAVKILGVAYPLVADVLLAAGDAPTWARRRGVNEKAGFGLLVLALDALADHYGVG